MTGQMEGQLSFADLGIWSGKTSEEHSHPEEKECRREATSREFSQKSQGSQTQKSPMFLYLRRGGGGQDASWGPEKTDAHFPSLGDYLTHSFGESPKRLMDECSLPELRRDVRESHLSLILEDYQHQTSYSNERDFMGHMKKYELSPKACQGILRRAEKRGKELPEELREALERQARE